VRLAGLPVLAAALVCAYRVAPGFDTDWLYHRAAVTVTGAPAWAALLTTPALFVLALLLTGCFLAWVPGRRTWFTALGAGTLYGYLLHGFLVKLADYRGWFDHTWLHHPLGEIAVTVAAAAVVTLLCTRPVQRVFRFAMEPKMEWAFKQDAGALARERERERAEGRKTERETVGAGA
jgi:fucose 4-O-acetylase-like acetyltransferase